MDGYDWTRTIVLVGYAIVCGLEWITGSKVRQPWRTWYYAAGVVCAMWAVFYVWLWLADPAGSTRDIAEVISRAGHTVTILLLGSAPVLHRIEYRTLRDQEATTRGVEVLRH